MKKVYSLAACVAIAASAIAAPVQKQVSVKDATPSTLNEVFNGEVGMKMKAAKAPNKAIASRDDLIGVYKCFYGQWMLNSDDPYGGVLTPSFEAGSTANEIIIKQLPYGDVDIIAYFDPAAMTLTINQQEVGLVGTLNCTWYCEQANHETKKWENVSKIVGKVGQDGTIDFQECALLLGDSAVGYYTGIGIMYFENIPYFKVNLDEYYPQGNAKFTDDALRYLFKEEYRPTGAVEVPCYLSADGYTVVVENPYFQGAWKNINGQSVESSLAKGYVVANIEDPEVVLMQTMIGCGLYLDDAEEGEPAYWVDFFPYNEEGYMVNIEEYDTNDVYNEYAAVGRPLSTFDEDANKIIIRNIWFGETGDPLGRYGFALEKNEDGTVKTWRPLTMDIELPAGFGSVNSIADDNNVAPRFFNLQGIEVSNPAAGELVIVKKGNKTSKTIVR